LKIQLAREIGKKEGLPREKNFIECAQEMMDMSARDEEARPEPEETGWNRVSYRRPRPAPENRAIVKGKETVCRRNREVTSATYQKRAVTRTQHTMQLRPNTSN
ncbi:hypothetical protein, partial [Klebsiella pneumoniae]|uniref:hypothetical protein n=1 Tax=Klebsiella pneumoniae TaxID=573 RepID=UPI0040556D80